MSEKINTYAIAEEIESYFGWNGDPCLEDASFDYEVKEGENEDSDNPELEFSISGDIEHPMSGYGESFNTAVDVNLKGSIKPDGTITVEGTYKMEVGPATYDDDSDTLHKNHSWSKIGEEESTGPWTAEDADDFIEGLKEIPQ